MSSLVLNVNLIIKSNEIKYKNLTRLSENSRNNILSKVCKAMAGVDKKTNIRSSIK
jgi:hypothetical protein